MRFICSRDLSRGSPWHIKVVEIEGTFKALYYLNRELVGETDSFPTVRQAEQAAVDLIKNR